jgi:hypothetical protein
MRGKGKTRQSAKKDGNGVKEHCDSLISAEVNEKKLIKKREVTALKKAGDNWSYQSY